MGLVISKIEVVALVLISNKKLGKLVNVTKAQFSQKVTGLLWGLNNSKHVKYLA